MVDDAVARHEAEWHSYTDQRIVAEHRELYDEVGPMARKTFVMVSMMLDEMHGEERPTLTDPDNRDGGYVEKIDAIYDATTNGDGVKIQIPAAAWVAIAATISALGLIAVALITG